MRACGASEVCGVCGHAVRLGQWHCLIEARMRACGASEVCGVCGHAVRLRYAAYAGMRCV
jgi:hypothetical protein